jgi:Cu2+-exporting ATPase
MKTSAIEVHDMLSVFSVDEVEKRIGEVPGVQSVTVNFAVGNATVRYDETQLEATDIKSAVRQRGFDPAASAGSPPGDGDEGKAASGAPPKAAPVSPPAGAAPAPPETPATPAAGAAPPDKVPASTPPEPSPAEPPAASAAPDGDAKKDDAAPDKE